MPTEPSNSFQPGQLAGGREVYRFRPLEQLPRIVHAVTTRKGGLFPAEADIGAVLYKHLARDLGCGDVAWLRQVHSSEVLPVTKGGSAGEADGLVTVRPGLALLGRSADCPLILAADKAGRCVGLAHASWRATVRQIAVHLIEIMKKDFAVNPRDIVACIGPSAGPDRYEVGRDVYDAALKHLGQDAKHFFIQTGREDKWLLDLPAANTSQLMQAGVEFANLYTARVCTIERNDLFPSYRVEGDRAERFAAVIGIV
jgi:YfiH family protein